MSDLLTHWAVFEDLRRLAQHDLAVEPLFAGILQEEREFARLGAISRGGVQFVPHILTHARQEWETAADRAHLRRRLAYALGGVTHFPTDYVLKPIMSELAQADWNDTHAQMQGRGAKTGGYTDEDSIHEISTYYDVHVFRQVYLSGAEEPFNRFLLAENSTDPGQALGDFVSALFQRALLAAHTFDPDKQNLDAWIDSLIAHVQPLYVGIQLYSRVFDHPDPAKMARYQVETAFYDQADPAIRLARAVQRGAAPAPAELESALSPEANRSGYARTLALGMGSLRAASAYWRSDSPDLPDLRQGFHWKPKAV